MAREKTGGRKVGAVNKYTFNVKMKLSENVNDIFVNKVFSEIELIDKPEDRVKARLKILEFFIPKPKDQEEIKKDTLFKDELMNRLFSKGE